LLLDGFELGDYGLAVGPSGRIQFLNAQANTALE
jgi:hypothetical protein